MKEVLLKSIKETITALENNEDQSIEVRGAVVEGIKFYSALAVIDEKCFKEVEKETSTLDVPVIAEEKLEEKIKEVAAKEATETLKK